jgi:SulP family sulfate permease
MDQARLRFSTPRAVTSATVAADDALPEQLLREADGIGERDDGGEGDPGPDDEGEPGQQQRGNKLVRNFEDDELDDFQYLRKYGIRKCCAQRESWYSPQCAQYLADVLGGLTVAFAIVPEAVSWALIASFPAWIGVLTSFYIGFITSTVGGRPAMISGAAGSMAVVHVAYMEKYCVFPAPSTGQCPTSDRGAQFIYLAVIFCGFFQFFCGVIHLPDVLLRLLPHTAIVGFVNGLAIIIGVAESQFFKRGGEWIGGLEAGQMAAEVLISVVVQILWPRLVTKRVPGPLVSIVVVTTMHWAAGFISRTVELYAEEGGGAGLTGTFPLPHLPYICTLEEYLNGTNGTATTAAVADAFFASNSTTTTAANHSSGGHFLCQGFTGYNVEVLSDALVLGVILCFVGLIESLLTLVLVNDRTETVGDCNRECLGQGTANLVSGMFQTMGGCAMIGQTLINVNAGGRLRVAGIVCAALMLVTSVGVPEILGVIPLGALVGVICMIVIDTFEWRTFEWFFVLPWMDSVVIVTVTTLSVAVNLAVGVGVGIALQSLAFSWSASSRIRTASRRVVRRRAPSSSSAGKRGQGFVGGGSASGEFDGYADGESKKDGRDEWEGKPDAAAAAAAVVVEVAHYEVMGPLFFGSADLFQSQFVHMRDDPDEIVVHLGGSRVHDSSGLEALQNVAHKAALLEKRLTFVVGRNTKHVIDRSADFLTAFDYVVSEENQYYCCPRDPACRRSCRRQRLGLCSCYRAAVRCLSGVSAAVDRCHRRCCLRCCTSMCRQSERCMASAREAYEDAADGDGAAKKAFIVCDEDDDAMKKLRVDFVASRHPRLSAADDATTTAEE